LPRGGERVYSGGMSYDDQQNTIEAILETTKTIAVVGLSSQPGRAGYYVPAYLQKQGYRIIPVNPYLEEALGEKAYPDLPSVPEPVDLVLLFRRSEAIPPFVDEAIEMGAKSVWMQLGIAHEAAAEKARQAGLAVVMDACMLVEHRHWR
jgi:predicted CoA-binding protein